MSSYLACPPAFVGAISGVWTASLHLGQAGSKLLYSAAANLAASLTSQQPHGEGGRALGNGANALLSSVAIVYFWALTAVIYYELRMAEETGAVPA